MAREYMKDRWGKQRSKALLCTKDVSLNSTDHGHHGHMMRVGACLSDEMKKVGGKTPMRAMIFGRAQTVQPKSTRTSSIWPSTVHSNFWYLHRRTAVTTSGSN